MANQNQNDNRNQQSDSKSKRQTQDSGKHEPIDPNNPVANKGKEGSQHGKHNRPRQQPSPSGREQRYGSNTPQGQTNTDVEDSDLGREEYIDETDERRSGTSATEQNQIRTGNPNPSKGAL